MPDYSEGKIYRICLPGLEDYCYVGSTVMDLDKRLSNHRSNSKSKEKYKCSSYVLFTEENLPVIELLEDFPCESKIELTIREKFWQEKFPDRINKNAAMLTAEEWLKQSREKSLIRHNANKEANLERARKYKEEHREEVNEKNRLAMAERAKEDPEYYKKQYQSSKPKRLAAKKEKVKCDVCQKEMNKNSLWLHRKSVHPPA